MTAVEPVTPGWYRFENGRDVLFFHLDENRQWTVTADNGDSESCAWSYIEQALGVEFLQFMGPMPTDNVRNLFDIQHQDQYVGPTVDPSVAIRGKR